MLRNRFCALLAAPLLTACGSHGAPPCIPPEQALQAPSAGCLLLDGSRLLVVEGINGKTSLPGGSSEPRESAQCTAQRETWEETGLTVNTGELLAIMDTGFKLFHCRLQPESGEIDPPPRWEVRAAYFLAPDNFAEKEWRFPEQSELLIQLVQRLTGARKSQGNSE